MGPSQSWEQCSWVIYGRFWVLNQPKNMGVQNTPKWMMNIMVNHGKPYFLMDDLGQKPLFLETTIYECQFEIVGVMDKKMLIQNFVCKNLIHCP